MTKGKENMFSTPVFAQDAAMAAGQPSLLESMIPMLLILVILWFFMIRPQSKRMKEHREMVSAVKRGDTVVTSGGIIGKVTKVRDNNEVDVEIAEGVKVKVVASTISDVRVKGEPAKD